MDFLTAIYFFLWWTLGFGVDIITHLAIFKKMEGYDWIGGVIMGTFGLFWVFVCYLALWSREHNGDLRGSDDEKER